MFIYIYIYVIPSMCSFIRPKIEDILRKTGLEQIDQQLGKY